MALQGDAGIDIRRGSPVDLEPFREAARAADRIASRLEFNSVPLTPEEALARDARRRMDETLMVTPAPGSYAAFVATERLQHERARRQHRRLMLRRHLLARELARRERVLHGLRAIVAWKNAVVPA